MRGLRTAVALTAATIAIVLAGAGSASAASCTAASAVAEPEQTLYPARPSTTEVQVNLRCTPGYLLETWTVSSRGIRSGSGCSGGICGTYPGTSLLYPPTLGCAVLRPTITVNYELSSEDGPESYRGSTVATGPCFGELEFTRVPRRCVRSNFQVGLKLPSTSTEFVRAYGVLSLEDAGPDHFVPRNWESRIYRLERRGSRRIARLLQRSHTTPRSPTLAARRLTVPARGLRPGPYAVRLVFDEDRPANYPSEEFVFRRCSG